MAFVVEDGTGRADATAYASVAAVDEYFDNTGGNTVWTALTIEQKEDNIVKASQYIGRRFPMQFLGYSKRREQALLWPRMGVVTYDGWSIPSSEVPVELVKATAEYAVIAAEKGSLLSSETTNQTGRPLTGDSIKVGPVAVKKTYNNNGSDTRATSNSVVSTSSIPEYPTGDMWLEALLKSANDIDLIRG